jgi:hypothetical protein
MNIIPLSLEDNVGDGLSKINYNFLNINLENCELQSKKIENEKFLDDFENLMIQLDDLIEDINYDFLEKMETTVILLSSYWNKFEFTVNYPFNSTNGFVSTLVSAGELGNLNSSTDEKTQKNIIADALILNKLYDNKTDAINALSNKEIIYVKRDNSGDFISWDLFDYSSLFSLSIDIAGNFYLNGNLVDIYIIPYYSIIAPKNVSISTKNLTTDFNNKSYSVSGKTFVSDKNNINNNNLLVYSVDTKKELSDTNEILNVTRYKPTVKKLSEIITFKSNEFKSKIKKINDSFLESYLSNPKLNNLSLTFLNKNYNPKNYQDDTIVNVVFFLYNIIGYDSISAKIVTDYWEQPELIKPLKDTKIIKSGELNLIAPSSNTTFNIEFTKKDTYIEKIVTVKYIKKTKTMFVENPNSSIPKIKKENFWEFVNASIGKPYKKGDTTIKTVDEAPKYTKTVPTVFEIKQFPTTILTDSGDTLTTKKGDTYLLG